MNGTVPTRTTFLSLDFMKNKHILTHTYITYTYLHLYFKRTTIPRGNITIFAYIPGTIWTMQHLTDTLTFKDRSDENCELNRQPMMSCYFIPVYQPGVSVP